MTTRVFLVPGFFGFTNLGDFAYFSHVQELLEELLEDAGVEAKVHPLDTRPTSSILVRARHLQQKVRELSEPDDAIHLIGHSTGGLDARVLASHGLAQTDDEVVSRIRSVITVATPHRGTPTAAFFTSLLGQRLLRLLSLVTVAGIRLGSVPLPALVSLGGLFAATGALTWAKGGVIDQVYRQVLKDFDRDRRKQLEEFFDHAYDDQTLLAQLSPEAMDVVHAVARPAEHVRCGSVVAMAPAPSLARQRDLGLFRPIWQAQYGIYRGLHLLASTTSEHLHNYPDAAQRRALVKAFGDVPAQTDNDAMVPALSQVWAKVVHATYADHMDVMGHFHGPGLHPRHVDWLRTGSNFGLPEFRALLEAMAKFILEKP